MQAITDQQAWIDSEAKKIYRVLSPPPIERVHFVRKGRELKAGDYGWGAPQVSPPEKVGKFICLEGSDEHYAIVWLADFLPEEIEFVSVKPALTLLNPYAVKNPGAQPAASPNCGPATRPGNSGVAGGPPSVS
jgi:hypothetical protein